MVKSHGSHGEEEDVEGESKPRAVEMAVGPALMAK